MREDNRGKKIALLAHCILNQNAKVAGLAQYQGIVPQICGLLAKYGYGIVQLPCPEMEAIGIKRWGQVKEQYETRAMNKVFKKEAKYAWNSILDYIDNGYKIILIGIDGSPSCGVNITESAPDWGGSMINANPQDVKYISGQGAFMKYLFEFSQTSLGYNLPSIGLPMDIAGAEVDFSTVIEFLEQNEKS